LQRLEKQVFGVTMHGTVDHRIETLETALAESDPGTGKPLAPRNNAEVNRLDQKASTPLAPPLASTADLPAGQPTLLQPIAPALTKTDKDTSADASDQDQDNTVLHISKERFAISGNADAYIHQVTSAMRVNPQEFSLVFERAKAEIQQAKWDRALSDLCDAISSVPNESEYYLARALVYTRMGNSILARADLKQAHFHNSRLPKNIDFEEQGLASKK
jgi:tetratricopeptide (TPR) repeat protein